MQTNRVLMVITSANRMGTSLEPTGFWLEEVAAPYYTFLDAKCEVTLATPLGGAAPLDANSIQEEHQTASTRRFDADAKAQHALQHTLKLSTLDPKQYDAIYFPGGHGTMEDLPKDPSVKHFVEAFHRDGKPIASVCHGVACLVNAVNHRGEPLIQSHRYTCFSNEEEHLVGLDQKVPFLLETKLTQQGGLPSFERPFQSHVVVDRQLFTGQNPASSIPLAEAVIYQLRQKLAA